MYQPDYFLQLALRYSFYDDGHNRRVLSSRESLSDNRMETRNNSQ